MAGPAPDTGCYLVVKHSTWKGKYKRILGIGPESITTYNHNSLEITNQWLYKDIISIVPCLARAAQNPGANEFQLSMYKKNKADHMKFSCDHRADILTKALGHRHSFAQPITDDLRSGAQKVCGQDGSRRVLVSLVVTPRGVEQQCGRTGALISSYHYCDMEALLPVSDLPGGLAIKMSGFGRLHIFSCERRDEILTKAEDNSRKYIGQAINVAKTSLALAAAVASRMGRFSEDIHLTSLCEFPVQKLVSVSRHPHSTAIAAYEGGMPGGANYMSAAMEENTTLVRRILALTESCLVERDPVSYGLVTLRPLCDIHALVRCQHNPQRLEIEWVTGGTRVYTCSDRDALLASLMDGARGSGHLGVHVRMSPSDPYKRLGPASCPVNEEVESMCLRFLQQPVIGCPFAEAVERFNANVPYSGLLHSVSADGLFAENKERLITGALGVIVMRGEDTHATSPLVPAPHSNASSPASTPTNAPASSPLVNPSNVIATASTNSAPSTTTTSTATNSNTSTSSTTSSSSSSTSSMSMSSQFPSNGAVVNTVISSEELQAQFHALRRLVASKAGFAALTALPGFREKVGLKVIRGLQRQDAGNLGTGGLVIAAMLDFLTFAVCAPYSETTDGAHFDFLLRLLAGHGRVLYQLFRHPSLAVVKGAGLVLKAIIEEGEDDIPERMQRLSLTEGALPSHLYSALYTRLTADGRLLGQRQLSRLLVGLWTANNEAALELLARIVPRGLLATLESKESVPVDDIDRLNPRDNLAIAAAAEEAAARQGSAVVKAVGKAVKSTAKKVEQLVERHMDSQSHVSQSHVSQSHVSQSHVSQSHVSQSHVSQSHVSQSHVSQSHVSYVCCVLQKLESVEKTLQPATKHIEKYYEQYLEKHVDLICHRSNVREVLEGGGVRVFTELMSLAHLHTQRASLPAASNSIEAAATAGDQHKEWYYQVLGVLPGTGVTGGSGTTRYYGEWYYQVLGYNQVLGEYNQVLWGSTTRYWVEWYYQILKEGYYQVLEGAVQGE
ncbi:hypothetical protein FHG87_014250 [Trinorchestia longiramus]|nr:hypothetical protein FHG87_014250 [Trinorchestia longiramus]